VTAYYPTPEPEDPEVEVENEESDNEQSQRSEGMDEMTPLPDNEGAEQSISAPKEIIGDVGEINILEGKRTKKPSARALGFAI
jgi:hypothetical protein